LNYLIAKKEFYEFIFKQKRTDKEIQTYVNKYDSYIKEKINNIKLINLNKDNYENVLILINDIKENIKKINDDINTTKEKIDKMDFKLHTNKNQIVSFIDDECIISDIDIFIAEEEIEDGKID
jgi:hypothetical protein